MVKVIENARLRDTPQQRKEKHMILILANYEKFLRNHLNEILVNYKELDENGLEIMIEGMAKKVCEANYKNYNFVKEKIMGLGEKFTITEAEYQDITYDLTVNMVNEFKNKEIIHKNKH